MSKALTEYIDDIMAVVEQLEPKDKLVVLEGCKNIAIRKYPQEFIDWVDAILPSYPMARHVHHDVLVAERSEALIELRCNN